MRRLLPLLLASGVMTAMLVGACDAYDAEPSPAPVVGRDAQVTDAGDAAAATSDASDASPCTGEPDWATPSSAITTASCNGSAVDLLTSAAHCGRCDHACGPEACVQGMCAERREDLATALLEAVHDGALFYSTRPGGSAGSLPHQLKRLVPGAAPVVLGTLEADASAESRVLSATVIGADVYVRTNGSLRRASASLPSTAAPSLVASLPFESVSSVVAAADRIYVTMPGASRIDQVFFDGGTAPFIASADAPVDSALAGARYVWLTQPFALFESGSSIVHLHEGTIDKVVYESSDRVAGIAIDGDDLFVMRAAANGAIMRIDLATGAVAPFYEGELDTPITAMSVAVDATHVYWLKGSGFPGAPTEIFKRARCGGAAVRIGKHASGAYRVKILGDRLYLGAEDGLFSIAK